MIGERIKIIRVTNKMSQDEFAELLNVRKQDVSDWENNRVLPPIDIIKVIALQYGVTADFLLALVDCL